MRLWEFLFGYWVAKYLTNANGGIKYEGWSYLGAISLVVVIAISCIPIKGQSHPGVAALLVVTCTAVFLATGIPHGMTNSILFKWLEKIGEMSYSIYLIHFPLLILYFHVPFSGNRIPALAYASIQDYVVPSVLLLLLTYLLYHFIESPFRKMSNKRFGLVTASMTVLIFTLMIILPLLQEQAFSEKENKIAGAWLDRAEYRCGKWPRIMHPFSDSIEITPAVDHPRNTFLLVGNSHADAIKRAFSNAAIKNDATIRLMVHNVSLGGGKYSPKFVLTEAVNRNVNIIVLHDSPSSINPTAINELVHLAKNHRIQVIFIDPVPVWSQHIPKALWFNHKSKESLPIQSAKEYANANSALFNKINEIKEVNFLRISIIGYMTDARGMCRILSDDDRPLYFDTDHLTLTGASLLESVFEQISVFRQ